MSKFYYISCVFLSTVLFADLSMCDERNNEIPVSDYQKSHDECKKNLVVDGMFKIFGGGYLDFLYLGSPIYNVRFENGECGVDSVDMSFWWTGAEAIPDSSKFIVDRINGLPKEWSLYKVVTLLGDSRRVLDCAGRKGASDCNEPDKNSLAGSDISDWPENLKIKLRRYPGLEIWLLGDPPYDKNSLVINSFVMSDWPRKDGRPRRINCWGLNNARFDSAGLSVKKLSLLSREQLEDIDFAGRLGKGVACQVEYWDFNFDGGASRVIFSSENLVSATTALRAIKSYMEAAVVKERSK